MTEQSQRGEGVDRVHVLEHIQRIVGESRLRAGAEQAGVVDGDVETAERCHSLGDVAPVHGVSDVAGNGRHGPGGAQPRDAVLEYRSVASVDDDLPAAAREFGGEGVPQAPGATGDQSHGRR